MVSAVRLYLLCTLLFPAITYSTGQTLRNGTYKFALAIEDLLDSKLLDGSVIKYCTASLPSLPCVRVCNQICLIYRVYVLPAKIFDSQGIFEIKIWLHS